MSRPPPSGPHSDIDGVHQDELPKQEATMKAGQDPANLMSWPPMPANMAR
jgi:hypothetical protein